MTNDEAMGVVIWVGMFSFTGICMVIGARRRRGSVARLTGLDKTIYRWNDIDCLTTRNLLAGGIHAFGRTDGGKTSSLKQVARAILKQGGAMLVLCAKKGERHEWVELAKAAGREGDCVVIHPTQPWRFNMVGYEASRVGEGAGSATAVTRFIMELRSVIFRETGKGGGDAEYWKKQDEQTILHAVTLLQLAKRPITPASIQELVLSAPESVKEMDEEKWQKCECSEVVGLAFARAKSPVEEHDYQLATKYFLGVWPKMADRTRGSIMAGTISTLSAMNIGIAREMFANETNITPKEAIEGKKIVIIDMPPDEWQDVGRIAAIGWKYHWQNEVLRREVAEDSPVAGIWGDESSLWITANDARYLSRCRSYRGFMVYICQSLSAYREALGGDSDDVVVTAMLSNFSHKLFFSLGDHDTAQWASQHCGKELQQFSSGSVNHGDYQPFAVFGQKVSHSSSFSEHFEQVVQAGEFMNGLRTGSPVNGYQVDACFTRSGVPFSNGYPLIRVTFDQRK